MRSGLVVGSLVMFAHEDRKGTCMQRCAAVDRGTCETPGGCPEGFACIHVNHFPVIAVNVCSPVCPPGGNVDCFVGSAACAPEIEADEVLKFQCQDDRGDNQYVCLP